MNLSIVIAVIISIVVLSSIYVLVIDFIYARNKRPNLRFKNIAIQLLTMTVWITILSNIFFPRNLILIADHSASLVIFGISAIVGVFLIRSMFREVETESDVEQLIERLNKNNVLLKKMDTQKTEFVSIASHQLRGPLTNIYGYISMMLEGDYGEIPENLREPINRIFKSSTFLGFLINDFLNVSRIEKGEMEYTIEDLNISTTLEQVMKEFQLVAKHAKLDFLKEFNPDEKIIVRADANKIKQIISNLIDNAIKYTPKGFVAVSCKSDNKKVVISVRDSGIGLGTKIKENLFQKFSRDKEAIRVNVSGSGLGLYVASVMIKGMNGRIWAESAGDNKGTIFYIELPLTTK